MTTVETLRGHGASESAAAVPPAARRPWAVVRRTAPVVVFTAVLIYLVVLPLIRLQARSLADGADAYDRAIQLSGFGETLRMTVALALGSLAIAMVLGTGLAWAAVQLPRRLGWLSVFPILPIVLPPVANVTGWAFVLGPRVGYANQWLRATPFFDGDSGPIDVFTKPWIVIITGLALTSFVYVFVRAGLSRINFELVEACQVSGAGPTRAFFNTILPLLRPSLLYGGAVALLLGLGQFTPPLLLGSRHGVRVLATEVYRVSGASSDFALGGALASPLLVAGIVIVLIQRRLLGSQERFATEIGKGTRHVGRTSKLAAVPLVLFGLLGVVLPLFGLVVVAFSPFWNGDIDLSRITLRHFRDLVDFPGAVDAIRRSITLSVAGVLVALPVGFAAAEILYRRRSNRVVRGIIDVTVNLPLGVPAVVFGAGFLYAYTQGPLVLYGTNWVIVLVYVTLMLPYATRLQLAARIALGNSYEEAARVSGAGPIRTVVEIIVPLTRNALSGAAALIFVLLSHEFAASLFVRSSRSQVMGTILFDIWNSGTYGLVAAMALVMCAVTTIGVLIAVWLGGGLKTLDQI
jgi:iron(III) transport system permease protein